MEERFHIQKHLASELSAKVYLAEDQKEGGIVRIKRMFSDLSGGMLQGGLEYLKVLRRRYQEIDGPSLVGIVDFAIDEDGLWLAVPHRTSKSLLDHLSGPLNIEDFECMASQLLEMLVMAHQKNFFHGSISANGIDVVEDGDGVRYRFTEFGYRRLYQIIENAALINDLPAEPSVTAPELFDKNEEADAASDIYMLGHVFYMALRGGHPWADLSEDEAFKAHQKHDIALLHKVKKTIPKELSEWIDSLIQSDPIKRPRDAQVALESMPEIALTKTLGQIRGEVVSEKAAEYAKTNLAPDKKPQENIRRKIAPWMIYSFIGLSAVVMGIWLVSWVNNAATENAEFGSIDSGVQMTDDRIPEGSESLESPEETEVRNKLDSEPHSVPKPADPTKSTELVENKDTINSLDNLPNSKGEKKKLVNETLEFDFDSNKSQKSEPNVSLNGTAKIDGGRLLLEDENASAKVEIELSSWAEITVAGWFFPNLKSESGRLFYMGSYEDGFFSLNIDPQKSAANAVVKMGGAGGNFEIKGQYSPTLEEAQHFAVTFNGDVMQYFLNGVRVGKKKTSFTPLNFLSDKNQYVHGKVEGIEGRAFNGSIFHMTYFPKVLNAPQILRNYRAGKDMKYGQKIIQARDSRNSSRDLVDGSANKDLFFLPPDTIKNRKAIDPKYQPLAAAGLTLKYQNLCAEPVGENLLFSQLRGWNEKKPIGISFSKAVGIVEVEIESLKKGDPELTLKTFSDENSKNLIAEYNIDPIENVALAAKPQGKFIKLKNLNSIKSGVRNIQLVSKGKKKVFLRGLKLSLAEKIDKIETKNASADTNESKKFKTTILNFENSDTFQNIKEIPATYQPLIEQNVKMTFKNVGVYNTDNNWDLFQLKGNEKKALSICFSHPVQIDSFDVTNHYTNAAKILVAAFSDTKSKNLLAKYSIPVFERIDSEDGTEFEFLTVTNLAELGPKVRKLIVLAKSKSGRANAHVDNLKVRVQEGIKIRDEMVAEDGIYEGEMDVKLSSELLEGTVYSKPAFLMRRETYGESNLLTKKQPIGKSWFQVDLKEVKEIKRIQIFKSSGYLHRGNQLLLSVSVDGYTWEQVAKSNNMKKSSLEEWFVLNRDARFIKFKTGREGQIDLSGINFELNKFLPSGD